MSALNLPREPPHRHWRKGWRQLVRFKRDWVAKGVQHSVDPEMIATKLIAVQTPDLLDALEKFGGLMIGEVQQRYGLLDAKALTVLGFTSAMFAFLLFGRPDWLTATDSLERGLLGGAVIVAISGVGFAFAALRIQRIPWPSEQDWFCEKLFGSPYDLRCYHLRSLLLAHHACDRANQTKAWALLRAQLLLAAAALALGFTVLSRLLGAWWSISLLDVLKRLAQPL